jgi:hypothetical protein
VGNVHYDEFSWHFNSSNVRNQPFSEIWSEATDPRLPRLRDRTSSLPLTCRERQFIKVCNGNLRTRTEAATGDWMGFDPSCYLTLDKRKGVGVSAGECAINIIRRIAKPLPQRNVGTAAANTVTKPPVARQGMSRAEQKARATQKQ